MSEGSVPTITHHGGGLVSYVDDVRGHGRAGLYALGLLPPRYGFPAGNECCPSPSLSHTTEMQ